eukprot:UN23880
MFVDNCLHEKDEWERAEPRQRDNMIETVEKLYEISKGHEIYDTHGLKPVKAADVKLSDIARYSEFLTELEKAHNNALAQIKESLAIFSSCESFDDAVEKMGKLRVIPKTLGEFDDNVTKIVDKHQRHERLLYSEVDNEYSQKRYDSKTNKREELLIYPDGSLRTTWKLLARLRITEFKEWANKEMKEYEERVKRMIKEIP